MANPVWHTSLTSQLSNALKHFSSKTVKSLGSSHEQPPHTMPTADEKTVRPDCLQVQTLSTPPAT